MTQDDARARLNAVGLPERLPDATFDDLVNPEVPRPALRTPGDWQEWLGGPTGRMAWAGDQLVHETNFMARAKPGEVTNGYVKSAATRDGLALWERAA